MIQNKIIEISVAPEHHANHQMIRKLALQKANIPDTPDLEVQVVRRSIDARKKHPRYVMRVQVGMDAIDLHDLPGPPVFSDVSKKPAVHIVGAGPAGYFAALELIAQGLKPVVLERGKDVQRRRRDLRAIQQSGSVNPDSNYCFGEGGAGTYSDGKLYTRATKRGDVTGILRTLVAHGADRDIMVDAHPHIGSNKLPKIVEALRNTILRSGGIVRFDARVTDILIEEEQITGVTINDEEIIPVGQLILATGHSARDIYTTLYRKQVMLEFKPFALGVRVEHPQPLIDQIQYGQQRGQWLPAASYQLTCQVNERGVFSFCMCPGGLIVPAATSPGEIVVNGMSLSRRDSPFANSGMVAAISERDLSEYPDHGPLAGMLFQAQVERACFDAGDGSQCAPAQRLTDFIEGHDSANLPGTSYIPGIFPYPLRAVLPAFINRSLQRGLLKFGQRAPGFVTSEAIVVATESRTSSPVRIPRDTRTKMHPQVRGLFPCGEGAGYAGGIVSAAIDGQNVAKAVTIAMNVSRPRP